MPACIGGGFNGIRRLIYLGLLWLPLCLDEFRHSGYLQSQQPKSTRRLPDQQQDYVTNHDDG
jgi:hypothetical protein